MLPDVPTYVGELVCKLSVPGRRSGRWHTLPIVVLDHDGERATRHCAKIISTSDASVTGGRYKWIKVFVPVQSGEESLVGEAKQSPTSTDRRTQSGCEPQ